MKDNPASKIKIKKPDNRRNRYLTQEEAKRLLKALLDKKLYLLHDVVLMGLYCGLRKSEIIQLKWEDIRWDSKMIAILDPKNGENRFEPMHPVVEEMLKKRYVGQKGSVFGIKCLPRGYHNTVEELGFNKDVTDRRAKVVFHTLRHTYASWLVMKGVDLYTTQKLMGHKTASMTQRYAHLAPGHLENAVKKLEAL